MKKIALIALFWIGIISNSVMAQTISLNSGVSQNGVANKHQYQNYIIHASAGDIVRVELYRQDADGNLYVKIGKRAGRSSYDCKSEDGGTSNETCSVTLTQDADVYISVYAYKCINNVQHTIKATIEQGKVRLSSGVSQDGVADKHQYQHYIIHASAGDTVKVDLFDQDADGDLYVKIGETASRGTYDCKSVDGGTSNETCSITLAQDAEVYIAVYAYKCINNVQHTIKATIEQGKVRLSSGVSQDGVADKHRYQHYVIHASAGDTVGVDLFNQDADGDLYVKIGETASRGTYDCKSVDGGTSNETCSVTLAQDADVYIAVYAYKCINNVQHTIKATIKETYGEIGPFTPTLRNGSETGNYTFYYPANYPANDPKPPLIFMIAGGGLPGKTAKNYKTLIKFMVSHGNAVLVSKGSYPVFDPNRRRHFVINNLLDAIENPNYNIENLVDTSKIGVIGHSTGGAHAFNVLKYFSDNNGYGSNGRFIYSFDPFHIRDMYAYEIENLANNYTNTNVIIFMSTNNGKDPGPDESPRIPLKIYSLLKSIPYDKKDFQVYNEPKGHNYVYGETFDKASVKRMEHVLKPLDALMAYTFKKVASAKSIALGVGSDYPISNRDNKVKVKITLELLENENSADADFKGNGKCKHTDLVKHGDRGDYHIDSCNPQGL